MRTRATSWRALGALLVLLLTLAACGDESGTATGGGGGGGGGGDDGSTVPAGSPWDEVVAAAEDEGTVNLYTSQPMDDAAFAEAFAELYPGIEVVVTREAPTNLLSVLDQEAGNDAAGADVIWTSSETYFSTTAEAGDLAALPDGPHRDAWADFETTHDEYFEGLLVPSVIATNTAEFPEAVQSYDELLDPRFAGRVGAVDARATPLAPNEYQLKLDLVGDDFLEQMAAADLRLFPNSPPVAQALGSGELGVAFGLTGGSFSELVEQGAPIEVVVADEGAMGVPGVMAPAGWSKNPNAAAVLLDFLMSDEGQQAIVEAVGRLAASQTGAVPDGIAYDSIGRYDASEWPADRLDTWLAEEWAPNFG